MWRIIKKNASDGVIIKEKNGASQQRKSCATKGAHNSAPKVSNRMSEEGEERSKCGSSSNMRNEDDVIRSGTRTAGSSSSSYGEQVAGASIVSTEFEWHNVCPSIPLPPPLPQQHYDRFDRSTDRPIDRSIEPISQQHTSYTN
uniref:Uncharacterized protein n=1 Tax=Onchocerca volvulus TaxID=6282 RepID=A0A8R1XS44_ONCVO